MKIQCVIMLIAYLGYFNSYSQTPIEQYIDSLYDLTDSLIIFDVGKTTFDQYFERNATGARVFSTDNHIILSEKINTGELTFEHVLRYPDSIKISYLISFPNYKKKIKFDVLIDSIDGQFTVNEGELTSNINAFNFILTGKYYLNLNSLNQIAKQNEIKINSISVTVINSTFYWYLVSKRGESDLLIQIDNFKNIIKLPPLLGA